MKLEKYILYTSNCILIEKRITDDDLRSQLKIIGKINNHIKMSYFTY